MAELTEAAEAAEEVISDFIEAGKVPNVKLLTALAFLGGCALGGAVGAVVTRRILTTKFSEIADEEIADMRAHFEARTLARETKPELSDVVRDYAPTEDVIDTAGNAVAPAVPTSDVIGVQPVPEGSEIVRDVPDYMKHGQVVDEAVKSHYIGPQNVFDQPTPADLGADWDYATEIKRRKATPDVPHVIHEDELGEEGGWDCANYSYFAEDDVLIDERESVVTDVIGTVGDALLRFGEGCDDPNTVFVRNPKTQQEYEISRSDGKYTVEVLGMADDDDELAHAEFPRRRRPWDDAQN